MLLWCCRLHGTPLGGRYQSGLITTFYLVLQVSNQTSCVARQRERKLRRPPAVQQPFGISVPKACVLPLHSTTQSTLAVTDVALPMQGSF
jgi:hypothetical protein